jgi:hypothetical protein
MPGFDPSADCSQVLDLMEIKMPAGSKSRRREVCGRGALCGQAHHSKERSRSTWLSPRMLSEYSYST